MAGARAFLLPVVIDGTSDSQALVPEKFREVQWTRLPQGANTDVFVERVRRLLSGEMSLVASGSAPGAPPVSAAKVTPKPVPAPWGSKAVLFATITVVVLALGYLIANRWVFSKHGAQLAAAPDSAAQSAPNTGFNPPPHSIAVLPFANMSGDKEQEYFSDGLTEELLNSLAQIKELQVAARAAVGGPRHGEPQDRPALGPLAPRAALSGDCTGVEVSDLSIARVSGGVHLGCT